MSELNIWEKAMGWRKRQMVEAQINEVSEKLRNDVLEEVAKEFDKMPFGDTAASFARFVRDMKR
jgi:transcription elongation GreA/GreB family factor